MGGGCLIVSKTQKNGPVWVKNKVIKAHLIAMQLRETVLRDV